MVGHSVDKLSCLAAVLHGIIILFNLGMLEYQIFSKLPGIFSRIQKVKKVHTNVESKINYPPNTMVVRGFHAEFSFGSIKVCHLLVRN